MTRIPAGRGLAAALVASIGLVAPATPAHAAPAPAATPAASPAAAPAVHGVGAKDALPGRYVVVLRPGRAAADARRLATGRVHRVFHGGVTGFTASMSAAQARRLAGHPAVAVVEQDRVVRVSATQRNAPWGLDRIDERHLPLSRTYSPANDARHVHAYVVDTGIRISHTQFGGRAAHGWDAYDDDPVAADCNGHGTHVAGTIGGSRYGVAKRVRLVAVRVLGCDGSGTITDVIDGVNWVTANAARPAVANMSLGGGYSYALNLAVRASIAAGITYVVAAGNENFGACWFSPASVSAAITVGATDRRDRRASFSNYGKCLDLFAPGVGIRSAWHTGNRATAVLDGTSMAAPHVAGAAAMILQRYPHGSPAAVRDLLVKRTTKGKITDRRKGSPNRLLYVP